MIEINSSVDTPKSLKVFCEGFLNYWLLYDDIATVHVL